MKTNTIILTALLAATTAVPALAAGNELALAVSAAAKRAPIEEVQPYAAAAAKADPTAAANVLTSVLGARRSWSASDVRSLYSAVLVGANLWSSFSQDLQNYQNGRNMGDPGVKLLTALRSACSKLPGSTFNEVIAMLVHDANGAAAEGLTQAVIQDPHMQTICNTPQRDPRPNPHPVTPDPISPQN